MPWAGGSYSVPAGTLATASTTIESAKYNAFVNDVESAFNTDTPVAAGGTGASTAAGACDNLSALYFGADQTLTPPEQAQARENASAALKGQLYGLTLSNNTTDATNDIDIAAGEAASTETNPVLMVLSSAITKRLDASWAVGDGNGGLDTGSIADTTYHVWLIRRSDTGVVDVLFSTSASSPTMPTNYDQKRRIGSILRESSAIVGFSQMGDQFLRDAPIRSVNSANPGSTAVLYSLNVPAGIQVVADITVLLIESPTAADRYLIITCPDQDNTAAQAGTHTAAIFNTGANEWQFVHQLVRTDTSAQVRSDLAASSANLRVQIVVNGWYDNRGRSE